MGKTVLPSHMGGGPMGLGDPDNKTLRKVETEVLIPKKIREKSRTEKCVEEVQQFVKCSNVNGISVVFKCRDENAVMKECLVKWFYDEEFRKACTDEYLAERSEFRRTGLSKKDRERINEKK